MGKGPEIMVISEDRKFCAATTLIRLTAADGRSLIETETPVHGKISIGVLPQAQDGQTGTAFINQDRGPKVTAILVEPNDSSLNASLP